MGKFSYPAWDKDLQDRVNATGGEGMPGIVQNFALFNRAGVLATTNPQFLEKLIAAVDWEEAISRSAKVFFDRMPSDIQKLGQWMEHALSQFLGFPVKVPEPPKLNRRQTRAFRKYGLRLFYVPAITEDQYPDHMVKPDWNRFLSGKQVERIPLPGRWIAFETIKKPDYIDKVYPYDRLMDTISVSVASRFDHKYFDREGGSFDIHTGFLPKIAKILGFERDKVRLPSAEIWNFIANFMNWLREHTGEDFPNLGSTLSTEFVANRSGVDSVLLVGAAEYEGLRYVFHAFHHEHNKSVGFRIMVVF